MHTRSAHNSCLPALAFPVLWFAIYFNFIITQNTLDCGVSASRTGRFQIPCHSQMVFASYWRRRQSLLHYAHRRRVKPCFIRLPWCGIRIAFLTFALAIDCHRSPTLVRIETSSCCKRCMAICANEVNRPISASPLVGRQEFPPKSFSDWRRNAKRPRWHFRLCLFSIDGAIFATDPTWQLPAVNVHRHTHATISRTLRASETVSVPLYFERSSNCHVNALHRMDKSVKFHQWTSFPY